MNRPRIAYVARTISVYRGMRLTEISTTFVCLFCSFVCFFLLLFASFVYCLFLYLMVVVI